MNSDFIYVKDNNTQIINMLIKKTDLCIIELNKLTMNNKENLLSFEDKIYYYDNDDCTTMKKEDINSKYTILKLGFDNNFFDKVDKKIINKKKNYVILFEHLGTTYITEDIHIYVNYKKIVKIIIDNKASFTFIKDNYKLIDILKLSKVIKPSFIENEETDIFSSLQDIDGQIIDINTGQTGKNIEIKKDETPYYIFKEFIPNDKLSKGHVRDFPDEFKTPSKMFFRMYKDVEYFITNTELDVFFRYENNCYLLRKCLLDEETYKELPESINRKFIDGKKFDSFLPKDSKYKNIYLYAKGVKLDPEQYISTSQELNEYEIINDICESRECVQFSNICNKLCANIDDYFVDILKNAKTLYDNAKCYQTYNDIHGAIFNFSNCASLFYSIDTILKKKISTFATNISDVQLNEFYTNFDSKNTEVLLCLKNLQEQFKLMNRNEKPEEDDVSTCGNIKNVVFKSASDCTFFEDVIGLETAKEKIVSTFIMPIIYPSLFGKLSKGILLYGPPGTGKTLLVKAAINSLQRDYVSFGLSVLFFSPTPADLKGKYVGESEKKIKELFNCASAHACKCQEENKSSMKYISVIFIDEIDNVGGNRSTDETGMSKQTVNALLQAMDGLDSRKNIIVMGATNNPWELDSALLRRFNNSLFINLPNDINIRMLLEKEIYDYILNTTNYNDMCKKKNIYNEAEQSCISICNAVKKEINIREELMKLNQKFNILPSNYENVIQKLSIDMYKKQFSNSDVNQLLRVSFSKMGSRSIQNELFINLEMGNHEYISGQSVKAIVSNIQSVSKDEWNNSPHRINFLKYFFNYKLPFEYYLSSFNKNNYQKFQKPYIKINDDIYLNLVYCVDRNPILYLNFENIKAAYIKKECYESMVKQKNGEQVSKLMDLYQCKILIEKDVEIVSEMDPLLNKYKSVMPSVPITYIEQLKKFFLDNDNLLIFCLPSVYIWLKKPVLDLFQYIWSFLPNLSTKATSNITGAIQTINSSIGQSPTLWEYITTITWDNALKKSVSATGIIFAIKQIIKVLVVRDNSSDIDECYNLYMIESKPILILYYMMSKLMDEKLQQLLQAQNIIYNEDSNNNKITLTYKIKDNSYSIDLTPVQNPMKEIFDIHILPAKYTMIAIIISKFKTDSSNNYSKIYINHNSDFNKIISKNKELCERLQNTESIKEIPKYIKYQIISNLDNYKSLSIKKTVYFECEIDLLHKFNKTWNNKIEWLSNLMKGITVVLKTTIGMIFNFLKNILNLLIGGRKSPIDTANLERNSDMSEDVEAEFFKAINDIYQNITYLLLSNCNAYYYEENVGNNKKFTRVLVNRIYILSDQIEKKIITFAATLLTLINILNPITLISSSFFHAILGYFCTFLLGDVFFNAFEIPPMRTVKIANILKQEKIFVSYKNFSKMKKHSDFSELFNQTTSYLPLLNYIDTYTGLNRILYKITKNTSLISLANEFYKDINSRYFEYTAFRLDEVKIDETTSQLSLYQNDANIYTINGNHGDWQTWFDTFILNIFLEIEQKNVTLIRDALDVIVGSAKVSIINAYKFFFNKSNSEESSAINSAITDNQPQLVHQLNTFIIYLRNNYRLDDNYNIIALNGEKTHGEMLSQDDVRKILYQIKKDEQKTNAVPALRNVSDTSIIPSQNCSEECKNHETTISNNESVFYVHSFTPLLKNYSIYFDIIREDLEEKKSLIDPKDYLDLIKYEKEPDSVIQERLKNKENNKKTNFEKLTSIFH